MSRRTFSISADGTRIAVDSYGAGPGLLLISGATMPPTRFKKLAIQLADTFTVHIIHRRGRGASGPQGDNYSIDRECEDVLAVLHDTGTRLLFGHSYGGLVAMQTAIREHGREQVAGVVVYEPGLPIVDSMPTGFLPTFNQAIARRQLARASAILTRGLQLGAPVDRLPLPIATAVVWLLLATIGRSMRRILPTVPAEVAAALEIEGPPTTYAGVHAPTLFLVGERGPSFLHDAAVAAAAVIGHAELQVMQHLDHGGPLTKPSPVAKAIRTFFDESKPALRSIT